MGIKKTTDEGADDRLAREEFAKLPLRAKIAHIWYYYKWFIVIGVAGVIAAVSITHDVIVNMNRSIFLTVEMMGGNAAALEETELFEEFVEAFGEDEDDEVAADCMLSGDNVMAMQVLTARLAGGDVDLLVTNDQIFETVGESQAFWPLDDLLTEEWKAAHAGQLLTMPGPDGKDAVAGVRLEGDKLREALLYQEDDETIASVCQGTKVPDRAAQLIMWLMP